EADDEHDDADSSLGDDNASSTASISSSILKYREENGRTYHAYKDGKYLLPNDSREQERLDLQHHLFLMTFEDSLHLSPVGKKGQQLHNVLDIGTGTGLWALDFADEHPEAQVLGVDLSPIQTEFVPPNLTFQVDDLEESWTFNVKFDFIYSRMMTGAIADWPRLFKQSYDNLVPGGWLEIADICPITSDDGTMTKDLSVTKWVDLLLEGTKAISRAFDGAYSYKKQLEEQGFKNVTQVIFKWPQNQWPKDPKLKEIGSWTLENISSGLDGLSAAVYTRILGWSKEEMDVLLAGVRADLRNPRVHAYWPIVVVYGQKPE
ncbi:S-adenosyl-L-methionine-dependent methyltransferase, partial [Thelonectria olida]